MVNEANSRFPLMLLSTVTTHKSDAVVEMPRSLIVFPFITSRSAPESIIPLTTQKAPLIGLMTFTGTMGRMTLSFALTEQLVVVAASHSIVSGAAAPPSAPSSADAAVGGAEF